MLCSAVWSGNDNLVFFNQTFVLNGNGLTFIFDSQPPVAGQPVAANGSTVQMNFWLQSGAYYNEEVASGTHETAPVYSNASVQQATQYAAIPTCRLPSLYLQAPQAGTAQYYLCSTVSGATYSSAYATLLTINTTLLSGSRYFVLNATGGARSFVNLTTSTAATTQLAYTTQLDAPGSTGGTHTHDHAHDHAHAHTQHPARTRTRMQHTQAAHTCSTPHGTRSQHTLAPTDTRTRSLPVVCPSSSLFPPCAGNTNYVYLGAFPLLDGDGLTFRFNTVPLIAGQSGESAPTASMNLWYDGTTSNYLEENQGGRHESPPAGSTLSLVPVTAANAVSGPSCQLPAQLPMSFCFVLAGLTYSTLFSGLVNTTAVAVTVPATSNNQLNATANAFQVLQATGTRVFTNLTTGQIQTTHVVGLAPGFVGATQYVYYGQQIPTDWNGIAFVMDGQVAVAGEPQAGNGSFVLWYQAAIGQYLEETASSSHETTPVYSQLTFQPYSGTPVPCQVPQLQQLTVYYSFCSVLAGPGWTSTMSGVLSVSNC